MFGTLKITYADGRVEEYETKTSDAIRFERQFHRSASQIVQDATDENGKTLYEFDENGHVKHDDQGNPVKITGVMIEHLWFFGYVGAQRAGELRPFDVWMDDVESVEVVAAPKARPSAKTRSRSQ